MGGQPTGWTRDFRWDQRKRLVGVIERYGGPSAPINFHYTFRYDAFDRRVFESHDLFGANKYFFYDGDDVALTLPGNGGWGSASRWLHGPAVDEILAREEIGAPSIPVEWAYTDHLGSVRDVVANNFVTHHMDYNAFGGLQGGTGWYYGFTGREYDHNTGLNYHRHRWLDPQIGRWINEDPIGFLGGDANLNRYGRNGPTNFIDYSGQEPKLAAYVLAQSAPVTAALARHQDAFDKLLRAAQRLQGALCDPAAGQKAVRAAQTAFNTASQNLNRTSHALNKALQTFQKNVAPEIIAKATAQSPQASDAASRAAQASSQLLRYTEQSLAFQHTLNLGARFNQVLTKVSDKMGTCEQTARALGKALPRATKVEYLEVFVQGGGPLVQGGRQISLGPHYAIRVNNVVYDAFNRLGTPFEQWRRLLETPLTSTTQNILVVPRPTPPPGP